MYVVHTNIIVISLNSVHKRLRNAGGTYDMHLHIYIHKYIQHFYSPLRLNYGKTNPLHLSNNEFSLESQNISNTQF